jgi:hypothetical protein
MLDLTRMELILSASTGDSLHSLCLAGAAELSAALEGRLRAGEAVWNDFSHRAVDPATGQTSAASFLGGGGGGSSGHKNRPFYHPTSAHKADAKALQRLVAAHVDGLARESLEMCEKMKTQRDYLDQKLLRMSFSTQEETNGALLDFSESDSDSELASDSDTDEEEADKPSPLSRQSSGPLPGASQKVGGFFGEKDLRSFYEKNLRGQQHGQQQQLANPNPNGLSEEERRAQQVRQLKKQLLPKTFHRLDASVFTRENKIEFLARIIKTQVTNPSQP